MYLGCVMHKGVRHQNSQVHAPTKPNVPAQYIGNCWFHSELDVHRTHTPRCEVKKIIALWRMHAVMQGWKEVRVVKTE